MSHKRISILYYLIAQIEEYIPHKDIENLDVSKSTVGWQLDHSLKVLNAVCDWVEKSKPEDYEWHFNFWRTLLFPIGYIPRGKAKAPKLVLPPEIITTEDLITQIETSKKHIEHLKALPKKAYFKHFIFGMLPKKQTLRFLQMHTEHHLKIVRDILK